MPDVRRCAECGAELVPDAPEGLCPQCVMKLGFESRSGTSYADAGVSQSGEPAHENASPGQADSPTTPYASGFQPPEPESLARLFPNLEIIELVGRGGMGVVYKARQPHLDRFVALKILPPELGGDPTFEERFTREARALAKLNHPNIVAVYDFGQTSPLSLGGRRAGGASDSTKPDRPLFYFLMEYVDGANVRQLIEQGGLAPETALAVVPQICDALQFAHDEGIVHRDIKPENILIDKKGRVKIADFGLAKIVKSALDASSFPDTGSPGENVARGEVRGATLTGTGQVMGTIHYMAPEQMKGSHTVDHRADIYALGVVFYEMLTGELPIGRFEPPSRKVQIDVRLDEVVLRALESEPARRYQKASDVKTDVETIASGIRPRESRDHGKGISATPVPGSVERLSRRDVGLRLAGIAICFIGICLVFLPWARVWAVGATTKIDPQFIYADGTFSILSGIQAQVVFKGYHLWQGIFSGIIFFVLGSQLLATLERRHPPLWRHVTIVLGALAVVILSGAVAIRPPAGLVGGSVQFPVFGEQEREFYSRLYTEYKVMSAAEIEAGLRREGAFDLDTIQSRADQGAVKLDAVPRFAPWLSAGLGMAILLLIGAALAIVRPSSSVGRDQPPQRAPVHQSAFRWGFGRFWCSAGAMLRLG